jgi:flavin-dependent dehydrogenase
MVAAKVKVAILGGSVSGLHVAKFLLSSGTDCEVSLVERKKAIGQNIICAGGLASYMVKKLKLEISEEFIASKVRKVRFYSPTLDYAELQMEKEYGLILWRDRWEKWLGQQVEELGAKIHLKVRNPLEMLKEADIVVGADGLTGISRKLADKPFPSSDDVHIAIQAVGKTNFCDEEAISMFFGSQIAPQGYAWSFPLPSSEFRIGLGIPLHRGAMLNQYFKTLVTSIEAEITEKPKVKLIPTAHPEKNLVGNIIPRGMMGKPIALVGDAGLQTDPATGGGMAPAILGAKCLAEALDRGDLKLYDRLWKGELYRRNRQRYKLKQILCEMSDGEWSSLISELKNFKPFAESIGWALFHLIIHLAIKNSNFLVRHKVLRRLFNFK